MEFKTDITTHDVLTYSTKARKHKQVYPYLRYGLVIGSVERIPRRFFTHNEGLDFCVAAAVYKGMEPLTGADIADCILWCVTRPPNVNIDEMVIRPIAQATTRDVARKA